MDDLQKWGNALRDPKYYTKKPKEIQEKDEAIERQKVKEMFAPVTTETGLKQVMKNLEKKQAEERAKGEKHFYSKP
jgi:hypothetical protein